MGRLASQMGPLAPAGAVHLKGLMLGNAQLSLF